METRILESVLYTGSFYFLRHSVIERLRLKHIWSDTNKMQNKMNI